MRLRIIRRKPIEKPILHRLDPIQTVVPFNNKNILIIAAENSAENYAAQVVDEFQRNNPAVKFFGVGGDKLAQRGVDIIISNNDLAVVGIIEVVSSLFKLSRYMNRLFREALARKADAVLLIDYPDFNLRMAKKLKKAGIRVYYYISPTVWAWRYSRVNIIKKYVDHLFIIFPFEIPIYQKENIPFTYIGHPLVPAIQIKRSKETVRKDLNVSSNELLLTLLPGSRTSEVNFLLPNMLAAVDGLRKEFPIRIALLKADNIDPELLASYLKTVSFDIRVINQAEGYDLIHASDVIITTCGTSNLEIAMLGVPFTAVYRVNKLSYFLGKRFVKIDLYSIINILAGKEVIKELIQRNYTVENIVDEVRRILNNPDVQSQMKNDFLAIKQMLTQDMDPPGLIYKEISTYFFEKK
ncbi:MAG: lipid-A-disaccharide synthase [Candidatus Omnitrophota bacterium]